MARLQTSQESRAARPIRTINPGSRGRQAHNLRIFHPVHVAAADCWYSLSGAQPRFPEGQGIVVKKLPRAVPHLDDFITVNLLKLPGRPVGARMVERGQVALADRLLDAPCQLVGRLDAEIDPALPAPYIPMAFIGS